MRLHPEIAALREDDTPQRNAQKAISAAQDRWANLPFTRAVLADLDLYADPAVALEDLPALSVLFAPVESDAPDAARDWVDGLVAALVQGLAGAPLGHVALRHFTNGVTSSLLLGRHGEATLALSALDGVAMAKLSPGSSASFTPMEGHERVLSGHGEAEMVTCEAPGADQVGLLRERVMLAPGTVIARDGAHRDLRFLHVEGCLVTLRLQRRPPHGGVTHEYDLASGKLVHRAAGVMRESRHALMVNLLGRMGRKDAAPVLAAITAESAADDLRWQALREGLGLDTARGFAALCAAAAREGDALAAPAAALKAQLLQTYPALKELA